MSTLDELAGELFSKEEIQEQKEYSKEITIANELIGLRCKANKTQKDMAAELECGQAKVSKLESTMNDSFKIGDVRKYANALDKQLCLSFVSKDRTVADSIKYHIYEVEKHLEELRGYIDEEDKAMLNGAVDFFGNNIIPLVENGLKFGGDMIDKLLDTVEPAKEQQSMKVYHEVNVRETETELAEA